jgi:hypothetical protein
VTGGEVPEVKGCDALMELCEAHPIKLLGDRATTPTGSAATSMHRRP